MTRTRWGPRTSPLIRCRWTTRPRRTTISRRRPRAPSRLSSSPDAHRGRKSIMPSKSANVKNEKQYEKLKDKGMSKERAAKIANAPKSSKHGGEQSGKGGDSSQGGTTAQKKKAGSKGGKASSKKS